MQRTLYMSLKCILNSKLWRVALEGYNFFCATTVKNYDMTISTDADDKLESVNEYSQTRIPRKQCDDQIIDFEKSIFASVNSFLRWIRSTASPFCSFYASYLQQTNPQTKAYHLVEQRTGQQKLSTFGPHINYPRPSDKTIYKLVSLAFADASKAHIYEQLRIWTGLLLRKFDQNSSFHCNSWLSYKSKQPVKPVSARKH